jgi:hypothetical protein
MKNALPFDSSLSKRIMSKLRFDAKMLEWKPPQATRTEAQPQVHPPQAPFSLRCENGASIPEQLHGECDDLSCG